MLVNVLVLFTALVTVCSLVGYVFMRAFGAEAWCKRSGAKSSANDARLEALLNKNVETLGPLFSTKGFSLKDSLVPALNRYLKDHNYRLFTTGSTGGKQFVVVASLALPDAARQEIVTAINAKAAQIKTQRAVVQQAKAPATHQHVYKMRRSGARRLFVGTSIATLGVFGAPALLAGKNRAKCVVCGHVAK